MELILAIIACIVAIGSAAFAAKLASDVGQTRQLAATASRDIADVRAAAEKASQEVAQIRQDAESSARVQAELHEEIEHLRAEITQLRSAMEAPPPPPLPRARTGNLEDLREQLRAEQAAHASDDDDA
jgi:peptidoglycan hydrolase CwlO-like protein